MNEWMDNERRPELSTLRREWRLSLRPIS